MLNHEDSPRSHEEHEGDVELGLEIDQGLGLARRASRRCATAKTFSDVPTFLRRSVSLKR